MILSRMRENRQTGFAGGPGARADGPTQTRLCPCPQRCTDSLNPGRDSWLRHGLLLNSSSSPCRGFLVCGWHGGSSLLSGREHGRAETMRANGFLGEEGGVPGWGSE